MGTIKILSFMGKDDMATSKTSLYFSPGENLNLKEAIPDCSSALFKPNLFLLFPTIKCQF